MAGRSPHELIPDGLDPEPWIMQNPAAKAATASTSSTSAPPPGSPVDMAGLVRSMIPRPPHLLRSNSGLHQAVPANFHLHPDGSENFLDYPPDSRSADEDQVFYNGVLTALGPRAETAVVKTLARCHVVCSTRGCRGLERLRVGNLVKIRHYTGGALEGRTFVADTAGECTPTASNAGSRVGSREGSRAPSREPSRPRSPVED